MPLVARRTRWVVSLAAVVLVAATIVDLRRPPEAQWTARAAIAGIDVYRGTLSRVYARMGLQCRFTPTCSEYGRVCLTRHGTLRGGWLAARRVLRCGPWTPAGTVDPPPAAPRTAAALRR